MFKINKLVMYSFDDEKYTYDFKEGLNYFKGQNNSGKTEFYNFLDYMFGSSEAIRNKPWFQKTLMKATMEVEVDGITYVLTRSNDETQNYLSYINEPEGDSIQLNEYLDRINSIFTKDIKLLKNIRKFTEIDLTFRTFTMFNFLGEKGQGEIHDFLDKCRDIKYSVKLAPLLNFIFNNNLERIYELQHELERLQKELKDLEASSVRYDFVCKQVNKNIEKLGYTSWYTGHNAQDIKKELNNIKSMIEPEKKRKEKNIAELEVVYSNISEQIKVHENFIADARQLQVDNKNRKILLENLDELLLENTTFLYLVEPLKELVKELDTTIAFSKYTIKDKTIKELKSQQEKLKVQIQRSDSRFRCYTLEEKTKAIALIEEYLSEEIDDSGDRLKEYRQKVKNIKEEIKALQNSDDILKIKRLSHRVTDLYKSAEGISQVVDDDISHKGFRIKYVKRGNVLQPVIKSNKENEFDFLVDEEVKYYIGSMARHTLIQLCGYLGFLQMLLEENKYPMIPILVIDHISKPFDKDNAQAIGKVINAAYEEIGKENLQIFMFDDEEYEMLGLNPDTSQNLVINNKTGFNPFYCFTEPTRK